MKTGCCVVTGLWRNVVIECSSLVRDRSVGDFVDEPEYNI